MMHLKHTLIIVSYGKRVRSVHQVSIIVAWMLEIVDCTSQDHCKQLQVVDFTVDEEVVDGLCYVSCVCLVVIAHWVVTILYLLDEFEPSFDINSVQTFIDHVLLKNHRSEDNKFLFLGLLLEIKYVKLRCVYFLKLFESRLRHFQPVLKSLQVNSLHDHYLGC